MQEPLGYLFISIVRVTQRATGHRQDGLQCQRLECNDASICWVYSC